MSECHTCALVARRDAGAAPLWDAIYRTPGWDIVHAFDSALSGWLILVARRHIAALDEMTAEEAAEIGPLIRLLSLALKAATGCERTYVVQFAEAAGHHHVHIHVIARMADQPDDRRGPRIFGYLGASPEERTSEAEMNRIGGVVRETLAAAL